MDQDFYATLQVAPDAEREVIDGAYIRLTHKYHPDINDDPDAAERMRAINAAYDVLSDPDKRAAYDQARKTATERATLPATQVQDPRLARMIQVLELELRQGCNNDTLLGGLESYARNWARQFSGEPKEISNTAISIAAFVEDYGRLTREERRQALSQALARARNELVPPWHIHRALPVNESTGGQIVVRTGPVMNLARPITQSGFANHLNSGPLANKRTLVLAGAGIVLGLLLIALVLFQPWQRPVQATGCPQGCITPPPNCVIKGNINPTTGTKIYHVPGGEFYSQTTIDPQLGERWFCSEAEAVANGWRRSQK